MQLEKAHFEAYANAAASFGDAGEHFGVHPRIFDGQERTY